MNNAIVFFNHFHRGDLFTSKEFVRQIMEELSPLGINFDYWHYNHPKILFDVFRPITDLNYQMHQALGALDKNVPIYGAPDKGLLIINTWVGAYPDIFHEEQGVNMRSLYRIWEHIFKEVKKFLDLPAHVLNMHSIDDYVPRINWDQGGIPVLADISLLESPSVLFCNGEPMSNQSFRGNMKDIIEEMALKYSHVVFYCTEDINSNLENIHYTDHAIVNGKEEQENPPFWTNGHKHCLLNEIAWLGMQGDLIIGKNSGPFVFCENRDAYDKEDLSFISFGKGEKESMSFNVKKKCLYQYVTDHSEENIKKIIREEMERIYGNKTQT